MFPKPEETSLKIFCSTDPSLCNSVKIVGPSNIGKVEVFPGMAVGNGLHPRQDWVISPVVLVGHGIGRNGLLQSAHFGIGSAHFGVFD